MTRAYIRLDPGFVDRKSTYPDGAYAALIDCLCLAETQTVRGHFRDQRILKALLGRRGRWVGYLLEHGDLTLLDDGKVYVDGWNEWQEGDWKVGERVTRIRGRKKPPSTPPTVTPVTLPTVQGERLDPSSGGAGEAKLSGALAEQPDALVAYHSLTGRFPTGRVKTWLEELTETYGDEPVEKALADEMVADPSLQTLISRAESRLGLEAHEAEKKRQDAARKAVEDERKKIEEMPLEQRTANRERLAQMMVDAGLHGPKRETKPA